MQKNQKGKSAIILLGPTGSGKSEAAVLLALELGTEIISADSMQLYRLMDIGTGKPAKSGLARVPHHLIDVIWPHQEWSAGSFAREAALIMERLASEGKIPLVVGGTGLYIKTLTRGLAQAPEADEKLRAELLNGGKDLYGLLRSLDPETARLLAPADTRRIIRALEVRLKTKRPISEVKTLTAPLPYDFIKLGLTRAREELYRLIEERAERMLAEGLVEEVEKVLSQPRPPSKTAMQAIGYKEMEGFIKGMCAYEEAVRLIKRNTRRYAKRQFTWFKKEEGTLWVDVTGLMAPEAIYGKLKEALQKFHPEILPGL
ncbi:MAG: tRNA (adenosine(37)-N6)-dimethylallyltransferase MiaA [Nitrospiraceae bacterium]|nr:tRNA (adenosine(37)-N6)-dimethylallyltransferase MiaA [Nitrospiraceae bacterium]